MSTSPGAKRFVKTIFSQVPRTYERANHVLTFGLDILWRKKAVRIAAGGADAGTVSARGPAAAGMWVDMCSGTGETAAYLSRTAPDGTKITVVDFSPAMMAEARKKPELAQADFVEADINALPFPDESVDLVTMSFATRNINLDRDALVRAFSELHRIVKHDGMFVNLETSQPPAALLRKLFHLYIGWFVKRIGGRISGAPIAYAYLSQTIPRFYTADELAEIIRRAGFGEVIYKRLMFGVAAIHIAQKTG